MTSSPDTKTSAVPPRLEVFLTSALPLLLRMGLTPSTRSKTRTITILANDNPLAQVLTEDTVVQARGVTASIKTLEKLGLVKRDGDTWVSVDPLCPPLVPAPVITPTLPDQYSLDGLRARGYQVLPSDKAEDYRVWVGGAFIRITQARENGLI